MANNILFVLEGVNTERFITDNIKKNFFNEGNTVIQCAYGTTIYNLYNTISNDPDLDLFVLLKELPCNKENLKSYRRNDFAEVYLFFDYDGHTSSAHDEKLKTILELFNEETELGKIFISYPMVEALKHYSDAIDFKMLRVEAKKQIDYKKKVNQECNPAYINMPMYEKSIWILLIGLHLNKMNHIVKDKYSMPDKTIPQLEIFLNQLEKYINVDSTVAVLSSFPVFLFDYYGRKYINELITGENK